jgi:DNA-binding transcriptional LysR family regulator
VPRPASLSFDLLETFVKLVDNQGDAAKTADELHINQPSMSKRLRYLQSSNRVLKRPWLVREGKSWNLTGEGQKALPAVQDLMKRYDQLVKFADNNQGHRPDLSFACGRQAAVDFVRVAFRQFYKKNKDARVRFATLRGESRIEGVATGSLDLACVTHGEAHIRHIARRELHVELIRTDRLALMCRIDSPWAHPLNRLPKSRLPLSALGQFPLILPEPDAGFRRTLDDTLRNQREVRRLDIRLEVGGWRSIKAYVEDVVGVGVISESVIDDEDEKKFVIRYFEPSVIPATQMKLICRKQLDSDQRDLSPLAATFYDELKAAAAAATRKPASHSRR